MFARRTVKLSLLTISLSLLFSSTGFAKSGDPVDTDQAPAPKPSLRATTFDELFPNPNSSAQLSDQAWGVGKDLLWGFVISPGPKSEDSGVRSARQKLEETQLMPTSQIERRDAIESVMSKAENYVNGEVTFKPADLNTLGQKQLNNAFTVIGTAEKNVAIEEAAAALEKATAAALVHAQKYGLIYSGVRVLRKGTSYFFYSDIAARVYVWEALGKDPGQYPLATITVFEFKQLMNQVNQK